MKNIFILLSVYANLFAVDIDLVDPGDIYYINSGVFGDDRRVVVIRASKSAGKIKVKTANGDTEWVYPSSLLTKQENESKNTNMGWGAAALGAALLFEAGSN